MDEIKKIDGELSWNLSVRLREKHKKNKSRKNEECLNNNRLGIHFTFQMLHSHKFDVID